MTLKQIKNRAGFTLTEVMIGMMILTVAIVSATNLLIGLMQSNHNNLTTLQAYYLAQEGLEEVRNLRDTNWVNNRDWFKDIDKEHKESGIKLENLEFNRTTIWDEYDCSKPKGDFACDENDKQKHILVSSKVSWDLGSKQREVVLYEVLTDWKGGAL